MFLYYSFMFCFRQQRFYSTELNSTSETKSCYCRAAVELQSSQLSTAVARRLKQALAIWISLSKRKLSQFIFRYATANRISRICDKNK